MKINLSHNNSGVSRVTVTTLAVIGLIVVISAAVLANSMIHSGSNLPGTASQASGTTGASNSTSTVSSFGGTGTGNVNSSVTVSILAGSSTNATSIFYSPTNVTLVIGANNTVIWTNNDTAPHTVTSDSGVFDSGRLNPGQSWMYTFTGAGTYKYHCTIDPWMHGTIMVKLPGT